MSDPCPPVSPPRSDRTALPWRPDDVIDGRFQIIRELGQGGMGAVYLVFDLELCREVALKRIHPVGVGDPSHEERFRREYRALAAVRDPGVPHAHHSGRTADGTAWFAMEAVRGESLRSILERDRLAPGRALGLAIELGKILAVAHEAGVIHRDVKPGNVMIEPGDRVRLLDFGVCTPLPRFLRAAEPRRRTAHVDRWESGEQQFVGTVGYSDPATHDGEPATIRSDVYSLAAIVYEMLTRRRLCDPDSMARRHIDSAEFPVALATLSADLRRATAINPFERQRSMAEFVQCLEIARGHLARAEAEAAARRRARWSVLVGMSPGIVIVIAALLLRVAPVAVTPAPTPAVPVPPAVVTPAAPPASTPGEPTPARPPASTPGDPTPARPPASTPGDPTPASDGPGAAVAPRRRDTGQPLALARRSLDRRSADVAACIAASGTPTRAVSVVLGVASDGRIRGLRLATGERSKLSRCIAAALADMSFPPGTPPSLTHAFELAQR